MKGTRELRVVSHHPFYRLFWGLGVAVICGLGVAGGYWFGGAKSNLDASYLESLEAMQTANSEQIAQLQARLVAAGLNNEVDSQTAQQSRETIKTLRDQIAALSDEVTFYKSLMAPSSVARGLQIAEFEIVPTADKKQFTFHILLTQVESRRDWIQGEVDLLVRGGKEQVLSLTEIAAADTYPLTFRFRYFQDLSGIINLPEGFEPESVEVTARRRGANATDLTKTFVWTEAGIAEKEFRI